ncbi:MAG: tetratricopeptide repeat protein, partial [Polyangia bacterium]
MRRSVTRWLAASVLGGAALCAVGCGDEYASVRPDQPVIRRFGDQLVEGQYVSPVAYEQYILAMLAENSGRLDEAVEALRRALGSDGTSAYLRWHLADALLSTGRVDEARDELATALQIAPGAAEAYVVKARLKARLGDRAGANAALERAIQLDPTLEEAYVSLAAAQHDAGHEAQSLATMRALAGHMPSATAEEALGRAALRNRQRKAAHVHLLRALELDASRIEVRLELARLAVGDGDIALALAMYVTAADRTRDPAIYLELARAAASHGRRAQALAVLDRLEEDAHTPQAKLDVAAAYIAVGVPRRALEIARAVLAADRRGGDRGAAIATIGHAQESDGALGEALAAWQELAPTDKLYTEAVLARARLLQQRGRHAEALALLEVAIVDRASRQRLDDRDVLAAARAQLRALLGEPGPARAQLAELAKARPRSIPLRLGLARLAAPAEAVAILEPLARAGDLRAAEQLAHVAAQAGSHVEEAVKILEQVQGENSDAGFAAGLGELYAASGRLDEAQLELELADRLRPDQLQTLSALA